MSYVYIYNNNNNKYIYIYIYIRGILPAFPALQPSFIDADADQDE